MHNEHGDPSELIHAFHLMWDHYPSACTLVHKSKRVVAANPPCKEFGREVGMICSKHGPPEMHKGCLGGQAITSHAAQVMRLDAVGNERVVFWLPVDGYDDYYIHFSLAVAAHDASTC